VSEGAEAAPDDDLSGRLLFRYVVVEEWRDYRAIMAVIADTFFSEFSPEEVTQRLAAAGHPLDPTVTAGRLESLRGWGNLVVSSAVGNPTSLADYYRRRNRYLITRAGQEVHEVVEGVLGRIDQVHDVSTGRLRSVLDGLRALDACNLDTISPAELADLVRAVFDPHVAFTSEITQFFAAINQWQSRYDLTPEEFSFFAQVLVGYVAERLDEVERTARPIGAALGALDAKVGVIVGRVHQGLAARVTEAGLASSVAVGRMPGADRDDWELLAGWFVGTPTRPSRITRLTQDAVAAIRTLTLNLTRLSRVGVGATSRRADFLRLARMFDAASPETAPAIAAAAFGLTPANHWGVPAADADDPVSTATSWWQAPRAEVAVSLRERGDTANRGGASPLPDRAGAKRLLEQRREHDQRACERVDAELLAGELTGRVLSASAFGRLQEVVGRTLHQLDTREQAHERVDGALCCRVERTPGFDLALASPEGTLTMHDLRVSLFAAGSTDGR
jgi:uncharacterized protein (TIGR02677 family)